MWFCGEIQNAFFRAKTKGAKFFAIGYSVLGKPILCCHVGNKVGPQLLVHGGIHAREHITTLIVCRQIEYCLKNLKGIGGIYFIPLVNPDGVDIAINGTKNICLNCFKNQINNALKEKDCKLFKANANLVDLNVNFDAKWGEGRCNIKTRGTENFVGEKPQSERETRVLVNFVNKVKPVFTISYHSKGEEIYYKFGQQGIENKLHKAIAKNIANLCGYKIKTPKGSVGGFKDYCVEKLKIPSVTIEVGANELNHPLTKEHLPKILKEQLKVPMEMLNNFVSCDIINTCGVLSKKKTTCELQFWKASARQKKAKSQLVR